MHLGRIVAAASAFHAAVALATPKSKAVCTNPRIRKEWRTLTIDERKKYIGAIKCMMDKPARFKKEFPRIESRFDDFVALHVNVSLGGRPVDSVKPPGSDQMGPAHIGGHDQLNILPWHRYLITLWEEAITEECGWHTGVPYWNWYFDVPDAGGHFNKSPVWDPDHGFGGNGLPSNETTITAPPGPPGGFPGGPPPGFSRGTGGGCVTDGPFKDTKFLIGPFGKMGNPHCLTRDINPTIVEQFGGISKVRKAMSAKNFKEFMDQISRIDSENMPGGAGGHGGHGEAKGAGGHGGHGAGPPAGSPTGFPGSFPGGPPPNFGDPDIHVIAHGGIGGEMMDPFNSLNEPLFYLHHGALDYYWAIWQEHNREKNLYDLDATSKRTLGEKAGAMLVEMGSYAPTLTSKEVADTVNMDGTGVLCFKYDGPTVADYLANPPPQAPRSP